MEVLIRDTAIPARLAGEGIGCFVSKGSRAASQTDDVGATWGQLLV